MGNRSYLMASFRALAIAALTPFFARRARTSAFALDLSWRAQHPNVPFPPPLHSNLTGRVVREHHLPAFSQDHSVINVSPLPERVAAASAELQGLVDSAQVPEVDARVPGRRG